MARNGCQEFRSYFCIISPNQLVFCDTVEKSRDVKLKHFYTSLLCLPINIHAQLKTLAPEISCPQVSFVPSKRAGGKNVWQCQKHGHYSKQDGKWKPKFINTLFIKEHVHARSRVLFYGSFWFFLMVGGVPPIRVLSGKGK